MSDEYDLDDGPDPAAFAAATPEPADDREPLTAPAAESAAAQAAIPAVGIGPGNPDLLTPRGRRAIEDADVVVGFESVIDYVRDAIGGDALGCGYRTEAETLERFAARVADGESGAAVLMGDPNHSGYQFLGKVERAVAEADGVDAHVQVVPGISSLQVAASRARTPMEASTFVTLHRSGPIDDGLERLATDVGDRHLLVLPRPYDWMPERIAAHLLERGASPELEALVFERLTHEEEATTASTLGSLAGDRSFPAPEADERPGEDDTAFSDLSVLVVRST